ncbi:MarR family winged helix-turn-helix transcriptional regulator [Olivibacter sitiensis]|uniref:MarR family winged helix-turn-helix transcriptional regulator n=1 Tax=Olivibacter sitiensis TaxID=376470 RepID=UPI00041868FF|nr:MarR family transcriptional regulator [Olivibacter sitiensis]
MGRDNTVDYYLKVAWQSIANKYNQVAAKHGLTQAIGFLLINIHQDGVSVTQMAALLGVKSTSLSRVLSGMEMQGLIYRASDKVDKRSVRVFLTDKGLEKREVAKDIVRSFNTYIDENISEKERAMVIAILKKINALALAYEPSSDDIQE